MYRIDRDWYGQVCPAVTFEFVKDKGLWVFSTEIPVPPQNPLLAEPGQYFEGLWEQDVAEWFIVNPQTGMYVEINLASNGAWWLMPFSGPRQRNESLLPDLGRISTRTHQEQEAWAAEISIPEYTLRHSLGAGEWTHNACFILGSEPRQYLSWASLNAEHPDFHRLTEIKEAL